jgi:hypothetical protein
MHVWNARVADALVSFGILLLLLCPAISAARRDSKREFWTVECGWVGISEVGGKNGFHTIGSYVICIYH